MNYLQRRQRILTRCFFIIFILVTGLKATEMYTHIVLDEQVPHALLHIMFMVPMLAVGAYSLQKPRDA